MRTITTPCCIGRCISLGISSHCSIKPSGKTFPHRCRTETGKLSEAGRRKTGRSLHPSEQEGHGRSHYQFRGKSRTNSGCLTVTAVLADVALGFDSNDSLMSGQPSMGAFIGRYANRNGAAKFSLEGKDYQLSANNGPNSLHGGAKGSRFQVFSARQLSEQALELVYVFKDGEENYPGTLPVRVVYSLTNNNELLLEWAAVAQDKTTVANFTGHTFFNLAGDPEHNQYRLRHQE